MIMPDVTIRKPSRHDQPDAQFAKDLAAVQEIWRNSRLIEMKFSSDFFSVHQHSRLGLSVFV